VTVASRRDEITLQAKGQFFPYASSRDVFNELRETSRGSASILDVAC
jgi:hypothetical protein